MANHNRDAVLEAATDVLSKLGYTLAPNQVRATISGARRVSTSHDAQEVGLSRTPTSSDQYRLFADVRVFQSDDACKLYCRVSLQQQTTEAYRLFTSNYTSSDVPTDTPIDREAATTASQNMVWSTVRRIRLAERELLQAVSRRLSNPEK